MTDYEKWLAIQDAIQSAISSKTTDNLQSASILIGDLVNKYLPHYLWKKSRAVRRCKECQAVTKWASRTR